MDWTQFFHVLRAERLAVDLVVEREAGTERVADVRQGLALVRRMAASRAAPE